MSSRGSVGGFRQRACPGLPSIGSGSRITGRLVVAFWYARLGSGCRREYGRFTRHLPRPQTRRTLGSRAALRRTPLPKGRPYLYETSPGLLVQEAALDGSFMRCRSVQRKRMRLGEGGNAQASSVRVLGVTAGRPVLLRGTQPLCALCRRPERPVDEATMEKMRRR